MTSLDVKSKFDEKSHSEVWIGIFFLGLGVLFGWGIGGDRKEKVALEWAVDTTRRCEISYQINGYASVADCLKGSIEKVEEEAREAARGEDHDPRR